MFSRDLHVDGNCRVPVGTDKCRWTPAGWNKIVRDYRGNVALCDFTGAPAATTRGSAIAEEPRDALRQLKYYGRFLTQLLTRSSANPEEPCEHTVS